MKREKKKNAGVGKSWKMRKEDKLESESPVNRVVSQMISTSRIESSNATRFPIDCFEVERWVVSLGGHIGKCRGDAHKATHKEDLRRGMRTDMLVLQGVCGCQERDAAAGG